MQIEIGSESQWIQAAKLFNDCVLLLWNWVVIANVHWALNGYRSCTLCVYDLLNVVSYELWIV